ERLRMDTMTPDIKRILVPVDFSVNSIRALDYAYGLAVKLDAAIHVVHVCEMPGVSTGVLDAYAIAYSDWTRQFGADAENELERLQGGLRCIEATTEVLFGNAAQAIVDAADADRSDLIVMGTHGHGAVMHIMMGNVAERVVRLAPCPVLTVREPRAREVKKGQAAKLTFAAAAMLAALLLAPISAAAQDQPMRQTTPGGEV